MVISLERMGFMKKLWRDLPRERYKGKHGPLLCLKQFAIYLERIRDHKLIGDKLLIMFTTIDSDM